jgi:hypothetical protein
MSSECERSFSATKKMITDERHNLKADIIEADQCLKNWTKNGVVNLTTVSANLTAYADDNDDDDSAVI